MKRTRHNNLNFATPLALLCAVLLSGCSTFAALESTPDVTSLKREMTKAQVEDILGDATSVSFGDGGRKQVIYTYREKIPSFARAVGNFFVSSVTLFMGELALIRKEQEKGSKYFVAALYDAKDILLDVQTQQGVYTDKTIIDFNYRKQ